MMAKYAIVIVGYNRLNSMLRLMNSLEKAEYDEDRVDLIFDLDNCGSDILCEYAENYQWPHGEKKVRTYPRRLGLRGHMIKVGEALRDYPAIAVLEDDVFVAPQFYQFMKQAVSFYGHDRNIFGIALYSTRLYQGVNRPFQPMLNGSDVFFQQDPVSWGQIWLREQWAEFVQWYDQEKDNYTVVPDIPKQISAYPSTSYLKYLAKYCATKNKYFVVPYKSYSTCFSDLGEHTAVCDVTVQVPIVYGTYEEMKLIKLQHAEVIYDAFYENVKLKKYLSLEDVCIDLYNNKHNFINCRYWLTTGRYDYKILKSYGLVMKPHELNIICNVPGEQIYLYDTSEKEQNRNRVDAYKMAVYDMGQQAQLFSFIKILMKGKMVEKLKKWWKR